MTTYNLQILLYFLSIIFCSLIPKTNSLTFNLTNIGPQNQNVNITTFQNAYISSEGLQVTSDERSSNLQPKAGKATYIDLLHLWDKSTGNLTDFDTHFVFVIDSAGNQNFADGLTFFLAPDGSNLTDGSAMGLPIEKNTIAPTSPFVAVEFDTFSNPWDPNISLATHVGIDVNSLRSNVTAVWYSNITHGIENEAWIRYDSRSYNLSVTFTGSTNTTRVEDTIYLVVDLRDYLPEWVTFGFSAATGNFFEKNIVKSWEFSSSLQTNETAKNVTSPHKKLSPRVVVKLVVGSTCKESDIYSFGVVALEIACGRRPTFYEGEEDVTGSLVEWVWDLYERRKLLEAADPKLGEDFNRYEMERLLILGVRCTHPNSKIRPSIREAIQVLNFEAPLACLPPSNDDSHNFQ
ncbi:hypothetical protein Vadar_028477 [Vaccinium darrowii]|uniref:Uncharacterized protein n=1 Tax=Vaccinium darrowii TaxID=229202 RepID=A0ACB7X4X4_9ERIC|nr:hypothetical protein Vadar_028477 [Vaccinium darrowii]